MVFYIPKREFQYLVRLCTLQSLLIVNCVILVSNVILCGFNIKTWLNPFDEGNSTFSGNSWTIDGFAPISATYRALLDRTLRSFVAAVEKDNLAYFIIGGALIGSLRHHGPVPWDDDIDVIFSAVDKVKLIDTLSALRPEFGFFIPTDRNNPQWKFYPTGGHILTNREFRSPYVDIFFYQENKTHIWNETPWLSMRELWLKRHVFPLQRRPFGNLSLFAPCNGMAAIERYTNISMCMCPGYRRIKGTNELEPDLLIPCQDLAPFYPFVRKSITGAGPMGISVTETLMFRNLILQEVTVNQSCL